MPQLSKYPLRQLVKSEIVTNFHWLIAHLTRENEIDKFLDDFLTETEKVMLAKRLAIAMMLEKGYSYFDIRDTLKVSTSTILRISHWLEKGGIGYRIALRKLSQKEKLNAFWQEISEFIEMIGRGKRVFPKR